MPDIRMSGFAAAELTKPAKVLFDDGTVLDLSMQQASLIDLLLGAPETVTPEKAAQLLGVSRPMVLRWIRQGHLDDRQQGTRHHITVASIQRFGETRRAAGRKAVDLVDAADGGDVDAELRIADARRRAQQRVADRAG